MSPNKPDFPFTRFDVDRMIANPAPPQLIQYKDSLLSVYFGGDTSVLVFEEQNTPFSILDGIQIVFYSSDPYYYAVIHVYSPSGMRASIVEYCISDYKKWLGEFLLDFKFHNYLTDLRSQSSI